MFKLTFSPASPYVRKVLLSAYRAGIQDELELVEAGSENDTLLRGKNPLGKIPVLQKPDGDFLFDSRVIVDHLNKLGGGLIPENGSERDIILSRSALAEGLTDASLLVVYSERYAGGEIPSKLWLDLQLGKIDKTLDFLEIDIVNWSNPKGFDAANIALTTALDYMSFRNVRDWKLNRPKISQWFDDVSSKLLGFAETAPK
jgi:glutathione S-transferase